MKVQFLRDFRGRATGEHYYTAGTVADLPDWQAAACLSEGAVEFVVSAAEVPPVTDAGAGAPPPPAPVVPFVVIDEITPASFSGDGTEQAHTTEVVVDAPTQTVKPKRGRAAKKAAK
jgi:hypothetical protein